MSGDRTCCSCNKWMARGDDGNGTNGTTRVGHVCACVCVWCQDVMSRSDCHLLDIVCDLTVLKLGGWTHRDWCNSH